MSKVKAQVHDGVLTIDGQSLSVPEYELLNVLGCGANAAVVKAVDQRLGRVIALKIYAKVAHHYDFRDKRVQALKEVKALGRLEHPAIARTRNAFLVDDHVVVSMDFYDAPTLRAWLEEGEQAVASTKPHHRSDVSRHFRRRRQRLLLHIASGLTYVYQSDGFHGDLHGNNVLVLRPPDPAYSEDMESPKLLDFGVSLVRETGEGGKNLGKKDVRDFTVLARRLCPELPWRMLDSAVRRSPLLYAQAIGALVAAGIHLEALATSVQFRREQDEWWQKQRDPALAGRDRPDVDDDDGLDGRVVQDLVGLAQVCALTPAFKIDSVLRKVTAVTQSAAAPDLLLGQVAAFAELQNGSQRKAMRTTDPVLGRRAYADLQRTWLSGIGAASAKDKQV